MRYPLMVSLFTISSVILLSTISQASAFSTFNENFPESNEYFGRLKIGGGDDTDFAFGYIYSDRVELTYVSNLYWFVAGPGIFWPYHVYAVYLQFGINWLYYSDLYQVSNELIYFGDYDDGYFSAPINLVWNWGQYPPDSLVITARLLVYEYSLGGNQVLHDDTNIWIDL